jgi:hypothetical protein
VPPPRGHSPSIGGQDMPSMTEEMSRIAGEIVASWRQGGEEG